MTVSPTEPSIYTAHNVGDILNSLPMLMGFMPDESLVAVATHGPRRRFGFRMRVDLPAAEHMSRVARLVTHHMVANGANGVILIAVTKHQERARRLLDEVCAMLAPSPASLVLRVRTDGTRYWTDALGHSPEGTEFEFDPGHESLVHAVAGGQEIVQSREQLVQRFEGPTGDRLADLQGVAVEVTKQPLGSLAHRRAYALDFMQRASARQEITDVDALRMCRAVESIAVRDTVWEHITRDNAREMFAALMQAVAVAIAPWQPSVLSLAGFAAWLMGDGTQALIALERALHIDPQYSMAAGLMELIEAGVPPTTWSW